MVTKTKVKKKILQVTLIRGFSDNKETLGMLQIKGVDHKPIYTLEMQDNKNKIRNSCIPKGLYVCKRYNSKKYKKVYEVKNVKGRTKILIHVGNTFKDTSGCILLGLSLGSLVVKDNTWKRTPAVLNSRKALAYFRNLVQEKSFELTIK